MFPFLNLLRTKVPRVISRTPSKFPNRKILGVGVTVTGSLLAFVAVSNAEQKEMNQTKLPGTPKREVTRKRSEKTVKLKNFEEEIEYFDYVIVGGGTAAFAAVSELKKEKPQGNIVMISEEGTLPYDRQILSKELWFEKERQNATEQITFTNKDNLREPIVYENMDYYQDGVFVFLKTRVQDLEPHRKLLKLSDGTVISYGKCLLATGSSPIPLDVPAPKSDHITQFRTVDDFLRLEETVRSDKSVSHITIIGGGQQSSELACGVVNRGKPRNVKVTHLVPGEGIMSEEFPKYLSDHCTTQVRNFGVNVKTNATVVSVDDDLTIHLSNGETLKTDHIVVSLGNAPNTELSYERQLEIDPIYGGFVTNSQLKILSGLYAAGDVASFYDPHLGRKRFEYHDHSYFSGQVAARNMLGKKENYFLWPSFGGRVLKDEYTAIGLVDSKLETVSAWMKGPEDGNKNNSWEKEKKLEKGVVYYMQDQKVVGVLLWNFSDHHMIDGAWAVLGMKERQYEKPSDVVRAIPWEPKEKSNE